MYTNNRDAYRQAFFTVWQKCQKKLPLEAVEIQLIEVIELHPEFHLLLEKPHSYQHQEFAPEENPFLHMSLHMALREQIKCDRPAGIKTVHRDLIEKYALTHEVEHRMMECLSQMIWTAQQTGQMPDDEEYLQQLKNI